MDASDQTPSISLAEVADVLRRVAQGQAAAAVPASYAPNEAAVCFVADGFTISIYVDAGSLDFVEWVKAPDGRYCAFDDWYQAAMKSDLEFTDPLETLSEVEQAALRRALLTAASR